MKRTGIRRTPKHTSKRHALNLEYGKKRKAFMALNPWCQVVLEDGKRCRRRSTDCHHRKGRAAFYLDENTWMAVCHQCHEDIHTQKQKWAREKGYLLNPASKEEVPPIPKENGGEACKTGDQ
jgi:hypothetical protein